jgi:hypothetical protein
MVKILKRWTLILSSSLLLSACGSIKYQSLNKIPVSFEYNPNHTKEVLLKGRKKFYMWGFIPGSHLVYVDQIAYQSGIKEMSGVVIKEDRSVMDRFMSFVTFGMFVPVEYHISGFTK